jgi:RHS repeat-associated protein
MDSSDGQPATRSEEHGTERRWSWVFAARELLGLRHVVVLVALLLVATPDLSIGASEGPVEIKQLRTETSETFHNPDGTFTTHAYYRPIHFRDASGGWQKISNRLVPSTEQGYAVENEANRFKVALKDTLANKFARFESGAAKVSLSLDGAAAQPGVTRGEAQTYGDVLPGVDISEEVLATGLKESIVLKNRGAPSTFHFVLTPEAGSRALEARRLPNGSIAFSKKRGSLEPLFVLAAPVVSDTQAEWDQLRADSVTDVNPQPTAILDDWSVPVRAAAVNVSERDDGSFDVTYSIDRDWLADRDRVFPVLLDPTMQIQPPTLDGNFHWNCASCYPETLGQSLNVGTDAPSSNYYRAALRFDLSAVPAGAVVSAASLNLYWIGCFPVLSACPWFQSAGTVTVAANRLTNWWDASTQTQAMGVDPTALSSVTFNPWWNGDVAPGWRAWPVTTTVQGWVAGSLPNDGLLMRDTVEPRGCEGGYCGVSFASSRYSTSTLTPRLDITWTGDAVQLAQPTSLHSNGVDLSWARYTGPSGPTAFQRYEIHRSTSSGFTPSASTLIGTIADAAVTTYRDTTAAANTTFSYKVVTVTTGSNPSNEVRTALPADGVATITLQPDASIGKDTYIQNGASIDPDINAGAAANLSVNGRPSEPFRSLVYFDLRDLRTIPNSAAVTGATVSLFRKSQEGNPTVEMRRLTADWTEGTETGCYACSPAYTGATWNQRNPGVFWATPGGDFDSTVLATRQQGGNGWDTFSGPGVSGFVDDVLHARTVNWGFILQRVNEYTDLTDKSVDWYSSDYGATPSLRPKLAVTYQDGSHALGPQVALGNPGPSQQLKGTVTVSAGANDDGRVASVQFKLDGANLGSAVTAPPYQASWNTSSSGYGNHTLSAVATDDAGNVSTSSAVSVSVDNSAAPTVAAPTLEYRYADAIAADHPSAYWRLGEAAGATVANDTSGNGLNGSYTGGPALGAAGALTNDADTAASLDGVNDEVNVPDDSRLRLNGSFTLEFWARQLSFTNTWPALVGKGASWTAGGFMVWANSSGRLDFKRNNVDALSNTGALTSGFRHFAITYDGTNVRWYVDGVLQTTTAVSYPTNANTDPFAIGRGDQGGGQYGNNVIDEVAVYPAALPAQALRSHFGSGRDFHSYQDTVRADQPAGYWRLGDASGATVAHDSSGAGLDGSYLGATAAAAGALATDLDTAGHFPATTSLTDVNVPNTAALNFGSGDFSVEAWVKTTVNNERAIVSKTDGTQPNWRVTVTDDTGFEGRVRLDVDIVGAGHDTYGPNIRVDDGNWHHVLVSEARSFGTRIYVDGIENATADPFSTSVSNSAPLRIGASTSSYSAFLGDIDEVAVYGRALTADQVWAHYDAGFAPQPPQLPSFRDNVVANQPAGYWRLGDASGATVAHDSSGAGLDGSYVGATAGVAGALPSDSDTAAHFSAASSFTDVNVPSATALNFGSGDFSVEAWVKTTVNNERAIVSKTDGTQPNWRVTVTDDTGFEGRVRLDVDVVGAGHDTYGPNIRVDDGNWHHVVVSEARSFGTRIYVDGIENATADPFSTTVSNSAPLRIGASTSSYSAFLGDIDEVAVYRSALTGEQARAHYYAGAAAGPQIRGSIQVSTAASDDRGVSHVAFYLDGDRFADDTSAPYKVLLNPLDASNPSYDGTHTLTAKAYDAGGNITTAAASTITVANAAGANGKYRASLTTASTIPSVVYYDPSLGAQETTPVTVQLTNKSTVTLAAATTKLRYQWIAVDGTATTPTDVAIPADLAPSGSTSVAVNVPPPTLATGVYRGRYRLRFDLYDTAATATFTSKGNKPLEFWATVGLVAADKLGLERFQQYDGEELGGGLKDAVNLANGNNIVQWVPFDEPGIGLNTMVTLTYNSLEAGSVSPLGNGWSLAVSGVTTLGLPLDIHPNAADTAAGRTAKWVAFTDADGSYHRFNGNTAGSYYTAPPGVHLYLKQDSTATADKRWQLIKPNRTIFYFDAQGYPTRVQDKDGNSLTFALQDPVPAGEDAYGLAKRVTTVTDQGGRTFTLAYYSKAETATPALRGKLKSITDHVGHRLRFDYYDDGNLMRTTEEGGTNADGSYLADRAAIFTYVNSAGTGPAIGTLASRKTPDPGTVQGQKLYSVIDFRGNETIFAYATSGSTQGRLTSRTDRAGNQTTFSYVGGTTVSKPLGRAWAYSFDSRGRVTSIQDPVNPASTQVLWTSDNMVAKVTEPTGQFTLYAYNNNGYLTSKTDQLVHQTTFTYQDVAVDGNDTSANWETGRTSGHISRITSVTKPVGNATTTNATDYKWTFAYDSARDSQDQLKTITDPLGNVTNNTWNANGTLASTTLPANGDGITRTDTYNSYDNNGLASQVTDAAGGITRAGYLTNGNLAWQQDPIHGSYTGGTAANYQTQYLYDSFGRLDSSSTPKSTRYRAGLLIWNDTGYDANDNATRVLNPHYGSGDSGSGPQTTTSYDEMDRPTLVTGPRAAADGGPVQTQTAYDAGGRVISVTKPNGVKTTPSGSAWTKDFTIESSYDKLDRAASTSSYAVDSAGIVDASQTRTVNYCYDLHGDLRTMTGPKGATSFSGCPAITTGTYTPYAGAYTMRFDYDAAHRRTKVTNPLGFSTQAAYDDNDAVTSTTDENNKQTTLTYNDRGDKIKQVAPFDTGRTLTTLWKYDNLGNVSQLISPRAYDTGGPNGPYNDYVESYTYDALNRIIKTTLPKDASTTQAYLHDAYDANGNETMVSLPTISSDPALLTTSEKTSTNYWDSGAIYSSTDPANPLIRYDYTAEGQQTSRIPESVASPGTLDLTRAMYWDYLPDGLTRALLDIGGERVLYTYDADGNQTAASHANGITSSAQAPLTVQTSFDGFDQRTKVRTQKPGATGTWLATRYGYDLDGNSSQMVDTAEEDTAGTQTAEGRLFTYTYNSADELTIQTDNFGTSGSSLDDEQYAFSWTSTGHLDTRTITKANGAGWTQEQKSTRSYYDDGDLRTLTNYDGNNNLIEDHALAYISGSVYMNGNQVSDVYKLKNGDGGSICFPTACTATWSYDARDRLTQETDGIGLTTAYTLDAAGNVTQEATTGLPSITRTYSGQQLTSVTQGGTTSRYLYDSSGNVDCVTDGGWTSGTCPAAGNSSLQTDYIYDYANRLVGTRSYSGGMFTDSADYVNDPLDRPVTETETHSGSTTTTQLSYIGGSDAVSKESLSGATSSTKRYAYDALGHRATIRDGTSRYSYLYDPHGSVSLLIDQSNTVVASYGYSAYGGTKAALTKTATGFNSNSNPYRYSGKRYDTGSKTLDMGARRYSAAAGRFLQRDGYAGALANYGLSGDPLTASRYGFAGGNPVNFIETDGHIFAPIPDDCWYGAPDACKADETPTPPPGDPPSCDCATPQGDPGAADDDTALPPLPDLNAIYDFGGRSLAGYDPSVRLNDKEKAYCYGHPTHWSNCIQVFTLAQNIGYLVDDLIGRRVFERGSGSDGRADAFRHSLWSAIMTMTWGAKKAKFFTDLHEPDIDDLLDIQDDLERTRAINARSMDLHNNFFGRTIGHQVYGGIDRADITSGIPDLVNLLIRFAHGGTYQPRCSHPCGAQRRISLWVLGPPGATPAGRAAANYRIYDLGDGRPVFPG